MLFKAYALFLKAACVNKKHNKRIKATAIHLNSCCWAKHDGKPAFSPPANSCCNMLVFTHNFSTCLSQISSSSYPPPFSRPYLPNNSSFSLRWWTFWVIYNSHTFQPAASFFSPPPTPVLALFCLTFASSCLSLRPSSPVFAVPHGQTLVKAIWSSPWYGTNQRASTSSRPRPSSPGRNFSRFTEVSKMYVECYSVIENAGKSFSFSSFPILLYSQTYFFLPS